MRHRPRRLRSTPHLREAVAETRVAVAQLIQPHFVLEGRDRVEPIPSMPGIERQSVDALVRRVERDLELGIRSAILFGVPDGPKDATGSHSHAPNALVPRAVEALRKSFGRDLVLYCDVCLCAYTDHGHCGVLAEGGVVDNDRSLEPLAKQAVACAAAGADFVAPSDMMDGRVGAIREALDRASFPSTGILAYSAKYASAYYGPFRDAAHSAPASGDRRSYQMDPRNAREALREAALDEAEGADVLMVKPALAYLDVIAAVRARTSLPVAAYNVSGEYSMVKVAAAAGWIDERAVVLENLTGIVRAGADLTLTYHAREA
ncbi:MAG TPA: porphobilinogen synthase, partial [Planctomycetota bacterium]|nr:porphobilinogen synthase [Planctomycetota bacterium]